MAFLVRLLVNALGLWLAATIVPGIHIDGTGTLILAALGIFLLVVNAAMFALVAWILPGFSVSGFWAALFGWLIVSVVSCVASSFRDRT